MLFAPLLGAKRSGGYLPVNALDEGPKCRGEEPQIDITPDCGKAEYAHPRRTMHTGTPQGDGSGIDSPILQRAAIAQQRM